MPTFDTPTPISVTIEIVGDARIAASDRADTVVTVLPRDGSKPASRQAAAATVVEFADGRLLVTTPRRWMRHTPFGRDAVADVTIELPTSSRVEGTSGFGDFRADGELGACRFTTAMGRIRLDHTGDLRASTAHGHVTVATIAGDAEVTTGSGDVHLGVVRGTTTIKNPNGRSTIADAVGEVRVKAANGDISIDRAHASVTARTANGDVRLGDVRHGTIVVETAVGEVEVGVHEGIAAWLDLSSGFGSVRNALDDADAPAPTDDTVDVRARTRAGDVVIRRSTTPDTAAATAPATPDTDTAPAAAGAA